MRHTLDPAPSDRASSRIARALTLLAVILGVTPAFAQAPRGNALALEAFQLEFSREAVTATEPQLSERFTQACNAGHQLACLRRNWLIEGRANLQAAGKVVEKACENGDPLGCLVYAWALDEAAATSDSPERTWRNAARILKHHCDGGYQPACHEYAFYLFESRGFTADPRTSVPRWKPACDSGFLPSCTQLALLELEGAAGIARNERRALSQLESLCEQGHTRACHEWGSRVSSSWDADRADSFFRDLCMDGHMDSCWTLASRHLGDEDDREGLAELLTQGCELGHPNACYESARRQTAGSKPDWEAAAHQFARACELGDSDGCKEFVDLQVDGHIPAGLRGQERLYDRACTEEHHTRACTILALGLISGVDVPRDPARGRQLLAQSCVDAYSDSEACTALAEAYEYGIGGDRDRTEAARYYRWACYNERYDACERRGDLLYSGVGIKRDDHEALAMLERACQHDREQACFKAGVILDDATYVSRDLERAADLYEQACDSGYGQACANLGRVLEEGARGLPGFEAARDAYAKGAELAHAESRRRLARLLWNGLGGRKDKRRARAMTREACQGGDPIACRGPEFL